MNAPIRDMLIRIALAACAFGVAALGFLWL